MHLDILVWFSYFFGDFGWSNRIYVPVYGVYVALTYVLFQPSIADVCNVHVCPLCYVPFVCAYGYMCRCNKCDTLWLSMSMCCCFYFGWCGAVSVRMQSIPFCERGNRNSVVVISSSFSFFGLYLFLCPISYFSLSWTAKIQSVFCLLVCKL